MDEINKDSAQLVEQIFVIFALLCREYDSLYSDESRESAEKILWALEFSKRKITTKAQVQHGLNKTAMHKWGKPPQLGQFLEWCSPSFEELGFPHVNEAFSISGRINRVHSNYIHEHMPTDTVINHVIDQIGSLTLREMDEKSAFTLFKNYYETSCKQFAEGQLKPIKRALMQVVTPKPVNKEKADEARRMCMEALRGMGSAHKRAV